jgi:hypothetical protein
MTPHKRNKAYHMLMDPAWVIQFCIALIFVVWIIIYRSITDAKDETDSAYRTNLRNALISGLFAFIIALCAEFNLIIAPFWIVFITSYYLNRT